MLGKLFLLFTILPVVELYLLITIGQHMGAGPTIALVLGTGLLGAWLARREGTRVLQSWQGSLARGEMPKEGVISSVLVLVGGVLLVTPGVVTDAMGLVLLLPWTRRLVAAVIRRRLELRLMTGTEGATGPSPFDAFERAGPFEGFDASPFATGRPRGAVIDVDAVEPDAPRAEPRAAERE